MEQAPEKFLLKLGISSQLSLIFWVHETSPKTSPPSSTDGITPSYLLLSRCEEFTTNIHFSKFMSHMTYIVFIFFLHCIAHSSFSFFLFSFFFLFLSQTQPLLMHWFLSSEMETRRRLTFTQTTSTHTLWHSMTHWTAPTSHKFLDTAVITNLNFNKGKDQRSGKDRELRTSWRTWDFYGFLGNTRLTGMEFSCCGFCLQVSVQMNWCITCCRYR